MKEKKKIQNTIGMFDLLKGVVMVCMVFAHNAPTFPNMFSNNADPDSAINAIKILSFVFEIPNFPGFLLKLVELFAAAMMPALLIVGGYGFRKKPGSKNFKANFKDLITPYIYTMIAATICNISFHYAFFRYLPGAVKESLKVFLGLALGASKTFSIGEYTIYANGPAWFLLTMFWSLIIFNIVMNYAKEKMVPCIVFVISVAGWLLGSLEFIPWCLPQGLVGVLYAYMGYKLKKNKFFSREFSVKDKVLAITLVFIPNLVFEVLGLITRMADNIYSLGPISYIENGLLGIIILYIFLVMNSLSGPISNSFRKIGRYSLYFMCVHTVEMIAIPWYRVAEIFGEKQLLGYFTVSIARIVIILFIVYLITVMNSVTKKLKENRAEKTTSDNA